MAEKRWDEMSSEEQEAVREQTAAQVEKFLEDRNAHAAAKPNPLAGPVLQGPSALKHPFGALTGGDTSAGA